MIRPLYLNQLGDIRHFQQPSGHVELATAITCTRALKFGTGEMKFFGLAVLLQSGHH